MGIIRRWGQPWTHGDAYRTNHAHLAVVNQPAVEPVTLQDVQRHLRIDYDMDDPSLTLYLVAARQRIEKFLRRALITQTLSLTLDWGPAWIELPMQPIQSITSIIVTGLDQTPVTASPTTYYFNQNAGLTGLVPAAIWPTHITPAGWKCTYVAGYGDAPEDVPAAIRVAILNVTAAMYDNRGELEQLAKACEMSLQDYRIVGPPFRFAKGIEPPELLA